MTKQPHPSEGLPSRFVRDQRRIVFVLPQHLTGQRLDCSPDGEERGGCERFEGMMQGEIDSAKASICELHWRCTNLR